MKKLLLPLIMSCCFWLIGCSTASFKGNTLKTANIGYVIEPLPVTADLNVSEQKTKGEAIGTVKMGEEERLTQEAIAKALNQDPPSIDNPDMLIGMDKFVEQNGTSLKVTVTGYPATYARFHTALAPDSAWLIVPASTGERYVRYADVTASPTAARAMSKRAGALKLAFGARAGLFFGENIWGFEAGLSLKEIINNTVSLSEGLIFCFENIRYGEDYYMGPGYGWGVHYTNVQEFVISVPLTVQYTPLPGIPAYLNLGFNLDLGSDFDFGFIFGAGYMFLPKSGVDIKYKLREWRSNFGFGVFHYF